MSDFKPPKVKYNPLLPDSAIKLDLSKLERSCAAAGVKLDKKLEKLINRFLHVHFTAKLHVSKLGGVEISIPDPELLRDDGPKELYSKHLYVNLSKYLSRENRDAAYCVKTHKSYSIDVLLAMDPINERRDITWNVNRYLRHFHTKELFIPDFTAADFESETKEAISPGICIPITALPSDHPAIVYLKSRGIADLGVLYDQFGTAFCDAENPQFKHIIGRGEDYEVDPLKSWTQGRLVFFARQGGFTATWQARPLDMVLGTQKLMYMHYGKNDSRNMWKTVAVKDPVSGKFKPVDGVKNRDIKRKYVIAPGTKASNCLMGFDAAVRWNDTNGKDPDDRIIGLVEGVFDAARLGPPFCAVMGAGVSFGQMALINNKFKRVYFCPDHDAAGQALAKTLHSDFYGLGHAQVVELEYPLNYKDIGEIDDPEIIKTLKSKVI